MGKRLDKNIRACLESSVSRTPDKTLFMFKDQSVSYAQVLDTVNKIANGFLTLGAKKEDKIAILLPNCLEFPYCWLAANMIGAVMVPVNGRFVGNEAKYILNHSEAKLVITSNSHREMIAEIRSDLPFLEHVINIDNYEGEGHVPYSKFLENSSVLPPANIDGDDLAVLLYTSGTTGNPKGCMASHHYFVNLADIQAKLFDLTGRDRVFTAQPFYYMDPQWNTLMVLKRNATLAFAERFSTSKFWDEIRRYRITCFYCIGSMTSFLFNMPPSELDRKHNLRMVQTSGMPPRMHKAWEERFGVPVYEVYASTETACDIAVTDEADRKIGTACIGRPVYYRDAKIVDENGAEAKAGEVGEIVLKRARGMMTGYYKDPQATEHAFRGGWFHSGDLGYKDKDGDYHFVGRKKDIIRRGGENITASSLEQILMCHPKILEAAVIPVPDKIRGEEAKAYIVLKPNEAATYEEIVKFCEQNMAAFKVPRYFEFRDSLPKTPSERVQKEKLKAEVEPKMEFVVCSKRENVAVISLNRPGVLNAANSRLTSEFLLALKQAEADPEVKAVVIRGEGRAFCAGHDLKEDTTGETLEESLALIQELQETTRVIMRMGKPVIAAVHGYALGAGCEWTMNCDLRIAAEGAKFGFPETSIGTTITNAGTKLLTLLVGLGRAKELVLTSRMIEAREAKEWGLVNEVVPLDGLEQAAVDLAGKIAKNPVTSTKIAKAALNQAVNESFEQTLEREAREAILMPIKANSKG